MFITPAHRDPALGGKPGRDPLAPWLAASESFSCPWFFHFNFVSFFFHKYFEHLRVPDNDYTSFSQVRDRRIPLESFAFAWVIYPLQSSPEGTVEWALSNSHLSTARGKLLLGMVALTEGSICLWSGSLFRAVLCLLHPSTSPPFHPDS